MNNRLRIRSAVLYQRLGAALLALIVSGCGIGNGGNGGIGPSGPAPTPVPTPTPSAAPPNQLSASAAQNIGAFVLPNASASPGLSSIASLETALGRKLNYDLHYYFITFDYPGSDLVDDAANGRTGVVSLDCSGFTNADIAAGDHDVAIDKMAIALKRFRQTVIVRYLWDMNSTIASTNRNGCTGPDDSNGTFNPADFIAAWDHLRARFIADGATNVKWFWCPNDSASTLGAYFPGASEVDYVGVDIYDRPPSTYGAFASHVQDTYASIEALAPKGIPFIVGETAATNPYQMQYFTSLAALYASLPEITAWMYFDAIGPLDDWRITPGTTQFAAFRALVSP